MTNIFKQKAYHHHHHFYRRHIIAISIFFMKITNNSDKLLFEYGLRFKNFK
jgi:hypothetical protein